MLYIFQKDSKIIRALILILIFELFDNVVYIFEKERGYFTSYHLKLYVY